MVHTYHCDLATASNDLGGVHSVRVEHLARQLHELLEINFTLKRQRNDAQAELRAKTEQLTTLQVTP